jgi:fumarylpyruvate hydrolase
VPSLVFPAPAPTLLPIRGEDAFFPVRRVYCVGRNYADHAREMGGDPNAEPPFFFAKNPDALVTDGVFPYPSASRNVHHEVELLVALAEGGSDIPPESALDRVFGYAVALDMTRRDLQADAKKKGQPWEAAKAVDRSAPSGPLVRASEVGHPDRGAIWLDVNGERRQTGDLSDLIWPVPAVIAALSRLFALAPGDVVLTGTPAGVGPVAVGDVVRAGIDGLGDIEVQVV